ncbi:type II toxin-antitoxin system HicA family toxin [Petroclostridium sp. X23]|uniref:type II toxin-antitoxin system HicA family toxin n=1 Tax=Petroclostridium sp. X23 TaxID=3045146 RepID=UPI0024AD176B|nr:type II toxin-antitoxin system HicA family toxin [Petroclostridium sp. X23]WHH59185.1 type II toxin-antitoxin system HicA family toxin [Petroclostridium sp. X23]
MTVREILKLLHKDGWKFKNQDGSHMYYIHPTKKGKVTVPNHKGDLKIKTAHSILKQAGLK